MVFILREIKRKKLKIISTINSYINTNVSNKKSYLNI